MTGDTGNDSVNLGGDGTSATVSGGGYVGLVGSNQTLTLADAGSSVDTAPGVQGESITGTNATIDFDANASGNIAGQGDTIALRGDGNDSIGVYGQNQTVLGDAGNDSVNLGGDGTSATVSGGGYVGLVGNSQSLTLGDTGSTVDTAPGVQGLSVTGTNADIYFAANAGGNVSGSGDTVTLQANGGDDIGVYGQNQTVVGDSGNDGVNLGGDGTSATVNGGGYVGLVGNSQSLTLGDTGSSVDTAPGVQGLSVTGTSATIDFAANAGGNVSGSADTINLQANGGDDIGVFGQNQTVTGDSGNDGVNLGGDGTSATVEGGGYVGLIDNDETVTLADSGSSLQTAPGVQNETINGSGMSITLPASVQVTINGSNDTVYGDGGQDNITLNGSSNFFSGTNDQVNFEGDEGSDTEAGTNDSYFLDGIYAGGSDPSGGFDDPGDPGDGYGDDDDPLVLNLHGGSVQTVSAAQSPARFDFHDDGESVKTGWGTPGEGYLVDAADGQTTVADGRDLVSSFMSLQKLDSNHDDRIDARDAHWNDLKVWVDDTGTAAFQAGSLRSLSDLGITSIDLDPTPDRHRQNGNLILSEGTFTRADGSTGQIADVDFRTAASGAGPQTARAPIAAVDQQASAQAAQLVSAMSTFGAEPAAETSIQGSDRPALIPMGVEASHPAHRHAA